MSLIQFESLGYIAKLKTLKLTNAFSLVGRYLFKQVYESVGCTCTHVSKVQASGAQRRTQGGVQWYFGTTMLMKYCSPYVIAAFSANKKLDNFTKSIVSRAPEPPTLTASLTVRKRKQFGKCCNKAFLTCQCFDFLREFKMLHLFK